MHGCDVIISSWTQPRNGMAVYKIHTYSCKWCPPYQLPQGIVFGLFCGKISAVQLNMLHKIVGVKHHFYTSLHCL